MALPDSLEEPLAVLVAGSASPGRRALPAALLQRPVPLPPVPGDSYLVIRYGPRGAPLAYVPGCREPAPPVREPAGRPPRRVEMSLPDPLLRHFALVDAPSTGTLGTAGVEVAADVASRGGAVLFAAAGGEPLTRAELDLLAELAARDVPVFFALVPEPADDPALAMDLHREAVAGRVPALAGATWHAVDPAAGDTAYLRRALLDWAAEEGLRRASISPPMLTGGSGAGRVSATAAESGWPAVLEQWSRASTRAAQQRLSIDVANIHLRCVQDIVLGAGAAGMPAALDTELHALSLRATAECDTAVATIMDGILRRVLATVPSDGVRRRAAAAVRRALAEDDAVRDLDRVLLVTAAPGVAVIAGPGALGALPAYPTEAGRTVLPAVGLAVAVSSYARWRGATHADAGAARSWLRQSTAAVELELRQEVTRRLRAVHRALTALIGETVEHGTLLA
ncbi:MAG TPA: hypothetical protein VES42_09250 [Pilimelia sp.]|nr:hypothetical protein [Pilimelia sp.]